MDEFHDTWRWYEIFLDLAGNDITRIDEMAGLSMYTVLNHLVYKYQRQELDNYLIRKHK